MIIRLAIAIAITVAITIIIMLTICGVPRQAVLLLSLLLLLEHPSRPIYVPEKKIRMREEEEEVEQQRELEEDDCDGKNPSRNNVTKKWTQYPPPANPQHAVQRRGFVRVGVVTILELCGVP